MSDGNDNATRILRPESRFGSCFIPGAPFPQFRLPMHAFESPAHFSIGSVLNNSTIIQTFRPLSYVIPMKDALIGTMTNRHYPGRNQMNEPLVRTTTLKKRYGDALALDGVSITLERGRIYGFIGQNGAGKTTLIRILTGLSFASEGSLELFGQNTQKGLENARTRIGCMIEHSGMYPRLSARKNLELQCVIKGIPDRQEVDDVLKLVGMHKAGNKKFKDFSMGMKQRLGIAGALLGRTELLILDEPMNGLDPLGVAEMRDLLIKLNREHNMTILISSHILGELHLVATDYLILHEGKIVDRLTQKELSEKCRKITLLETDNVVSSTALLKDKLNMSHFSVLEDSRIKLFDDTGDRVALAQAFREAGILLTELTQREETLESYFIHAIGGASHG